MEFTKLSKIRFIPLSLTLKYLSFPNYALMKTNTATVNMNVIAVITSMNMDTAIRMSE